MRLRAIKTVPVMTFLAATLATAQSTPQPCPVARIDTSAWVPAREEDIGIELSRPADYIEKRWESRSDTLGADVSFRRRAANTIDFHEMRGFWLKMGPSQTATPCQLSTRSSVLTIFVERGKRRLASGRDTVYFRSRATLSPSGKRRILIDAGASDSTSLLEQLAILQTIRFITDR